jgi:hypothetical protein
MRFMDGFSLVMYLILTFVAGFAAGALVKILGTLLIWKLT